MNKLIAMNSEITMGTREIAEMLGKQHSHIKVSAEKLVKAGAILTLAAREFDYRGNTYTEYRLGKRDCLVLVAQNSPEFTAAIVDRWQELEQSVPQPSFMKNLSQEALIMLNDLSNQLEAAKPKVEFFDNYVDKAGTFTFRETAKILKVKENLFKDFLLYKKAIYISKKKMIPYSCHIDCGRLELKTGFADNGHAFKTMLFTAKGVAWIDGLMTEANVTRKG